MAQADYATDDDLATTQAARRARSGVPSVSDPAPNGVQASLDRVKQASLNTQARAAANAPAGALPNVGNPLTRDQLTPAEQAAYDRAAGAKPIDTPEAIQNAPDSAFARKVNPIGSTPGTAQFEPEVAARGPAPTAPSVAEPTPVASASPIADAAARTAAKGGAASILAPEAITSAAGSIQTPTSDYTARGIPDVGAAAGKAAADLGLNPTAQNRWQGVGDVATRTAGVMQDYGNHLLDAGKSAVGDFPPIAVARNVAAFATGKPLNLGPVSDLAGTAADAISPAGASDMRLPTTTVRPANFDAATAGHDTAPQVAPGVTQTVGAHGEPVFTGGGPATPDANGGGNRVNVISSDAFTHPGLGTLGGPTPDFAGRDTRGTLPSVTDDQGESERRKIMSTLLDDQASRRTMLTKYAKMADQELQAGHKRGAAGYSQLAGLFDRGTPDFAPFARWSRSQNPAQQQQELARAEQERALASGANVTAAQKQRVLDLQKQADKETDPKKRADLLERIDVQTGTHGRRYQFPSTVSGYDDQGRPIHQSYKADTYTGGYEALPGVTSGR